MANALEINNLKKVYGSGVEALRGIDLSVKEGDFYALLGPNGAGKSTTIGIITSLVNKTSGKVKVFGYDLDTDLVRAKQQIGLVPQEFNFNPFETVQQIVVNQAGYYGVSRKEAMKRSEKSGCWAQENLLIKDINRMKSDNLFRKNKSKINDYYSYVQQKERETKVKNTFVSRSKHV